MGEQSQDNDSGHDKELSQTERAELERLRKENAVLKMERDLAKKVAACGGTAACCATLQRWPPSPAV